MNLKSKSTGSEHSTLDRSFAMLLHPSDPVRSDEELYAAVDRAGKAIIREFEPNSLRLMPVQTLTPEAFRETWQGD